MQELKSNCKKPLLCGKHNSSLRKLLKDNQIHAELLKEFLFKGLDEAALKAAIDHVDLLDKQKDVMFEIIFELERKINEVP